MKFTYAHLKSFRRERGAPYDQYVWLYSHAYGMVMRAVHRAGLCRLRTRPLGDRHCDWCGATVPAYRGRSLRDDVEGVPCRTPTMPTTS